MKILYVEDNPQDADLARRTLRRLAPELEITTVTTQRQALEKLQQPEAFDLVLTDMNLPDGDGLAILTHIRGRGLPLAVVLVTGAGDEESVVAALRGGADDYVAKSEGYLEQLPQTLSGAYRRYRQEAARRSQPIRVLYAEHNPQDRDLTQRHFNRFAPHIRLEMVASAGEVLAQLRESRFDLLLLDYRLPGMNALEMLKLLKQEFGPALPPVIFVTGQGDEEIALQALKLGAADYLPKREGYLNRLPAMLENAYHRYRLEREHQALQASEQKYRHLIENLNDAVYLLYGGRFEIINPRFQEIFGVSPAEAGHPDFDFLNLVAPEDRQMVQERLERANRGEQVAPTYEFTALTKTGERRVVEASVSYIDYKDGIAAQGILRDITERRKLEEQLRQSQKMEAVGQLTAGIAHDFNNLLTAINGFAELMKMRLRPEDPFAGMVDKILHSGQQAARLVSQLMAFSRKQIIAPQVLELNHIVTQMDSILSRIIGEHIQMKLNLAPELWLIKADPAQIEQVIVNLAVNARDAMPQGGQLIIETANASLDEAFVATHLETQPGDYVLLAISDTGCGMSREVKSHIFEPFFTTKEQGRGTGLGLATVYGIVKQNGGHIWVYSEEGQGATFKIYFPRAREAAALAPTAAVDTGLPRGNETILLVEDAADVRELVRRVLEDFGYTVLVAPNGQAALELAAHHPDPIHLLLTDVVMPEISGKALAGQLQQTRPELKVLFVSGYTDETIAQHGILELGTYFLQKPFTPAGLARKVWEVLR